MPLQPLLSPLPLLHEYLSSTGRWGQGFFLSHSSCFPECFLGSLELQWHRISGVRATETRYRSGLGDFSRSISAVSSQMISGLLQVVECSALTDTQWFASVSFSHSSVDVRSSAIPGIALLGWLNGPEIRGFTYLAMNQRVQHSHRDLPKLLYFFCTSNDHLRDIMWL